MHIEKYRKYIYFIIIISIIVILFLFIGKKYFSRLSVFVIENNRILIKNELNNFIENIKSQDLDDIYDIIYDSSGDIVGTKFNVNVINSKLSLYVNNFSNSINDMLYASYMSKYFRTINVSGSKYLLAPIGIISNNPFLYSLGPNIILSYEFITTFNFKVEIDAKNYGINSTLINTYLTVSIDQSTVKPVLMKNTNTSYKFLIASQMVYGKLSGIVTDGFTSQSNIL